MAYSEKFEKTKSDYDRGIWTLKMVYNAVGRRITADEYFEITGEKYS